MDKKKKFILRSRASPHALLSGRGVEHAPPVKGARRASSARAGFALAPILYMLGLIGVGAGILFSGYSQILHSNVAVTNDLTVKNDLQAIATTMAATSILGTTDNTILCPPQGGGASANCASVLTKFTAIAGQTQLPANASNVGSTGSPKETGIFIAGAGMKQLDPYGHFYVVCRWENATSPGSDPAFSVISGGPDGTLQTGCGDTSAQGDDVLVNWPVATAIQRSAVWQTTVGTSGTQAQFGQVGTQLIVDALGNLRVPGTVNVTGASTFASTGTFSGTVTAPNFTSSGGISGTTGTFSGNVTVGGTLGVTGATTLSSTLSAGASTLASATVTGNETVGGTLGVTGATTLAGLTAGATTLSSATVTNNAAVGGDLGVTGSVAVGSSVSAGSATLGSATVSGALTAGATTLASAVVSGNETVGGTLGVTGAMTGSDATFSGTVTAANFIGNLTGNVTGNATNVTGVIALNHGGTGYAASSITDLLTHLGVLSGGYLNTALLTTNLIPGADLVNGSVGATQLDTTGVVSGAYNWGTVDVNGRVTYATNVVSNSLTDGAGDSVSVGTSGINFYTNNTLQGVWSSSGYLGVGTSSPHQKLDVVGNILIEGNPGTSRELQFASIVSGAPSKRWVLSTNSTAESSNAGSDFALYNYDDSGVQIGTPLTIARATGNATFTGNVTIGGTYYGNGGGLTNIPASSITGAITANLAIGTQLTNTNPQIQNDGGSGLYTPAGSTIAIVTGATERMRVSSAGLVGIGTATPTQRLHVYGGNILLEGTSGPQIIINDPSGGTNNLNLSFTRSGTVYGTIFLNSTNSFTFQSNATDYRFKSDGSTERLRIAASTGNIGIGTTAPANKLDVTGSVAIGTGYAYVGATAPSNGLIVQGAVGIGTNSVNAGASLDLGNTTSSFIFPVGTTGTRPGTGFNGMMRYNSANGKFEGYQSNAWQDILTTATGGGTIYIGTQLTNTNPRLQNDLGTGLYTPTGSTISIVTNATERLRVDANGNVGIGTTAPDYTLVLYGANSATNSTAFAAVAPVLKIKNSDPTVGNYEGIIFVNSGDYATSLIAGINQGLDTGDMAFVTLGSAGRNEVMRATSASNVGIGTTAPKNKLDVAGAVSIGTGYAYVGRSAPSNGLIVQGAVGIGTSSVNAGASLDLGGTTSSLIFPVGTTGTRPGTGFNGMMRYNSANGKFEGYQADAWQDILTTATGGGTIYIGTQLTNTNPRLQNDLGTGLYTPTGSTVSIVTGATERVRVDSSGNVGIGSVAPSYKLDVNSGAIRVSDTNPSIYFTAASATKLGQIYQNVDNVNIAASTVGVIASFNLNAPANSFVLNSSGNIGIGTTAPKNKLDITGAVAIGTGYAYVGQAAPSNGLLVQGNVGIGTTTAGNKLDVNGAASIGFGTAATAPTNGLAVSGSVVVGNTSANSGASLDLGNTTSSLIFPVGTTGTRPGTGFNGMMRYNSTNGKFEGYQSDAWQDILTTATGGGTIYIGTQLTNTNPRLQSDLGTGLYTPTGSTVSIVTNAAERFRVDSSGNILIGATSSSLVKMQVTPGTSADTGIFVYEPTDIGTGSNILAYNADIKLNHATTTGQLQGYVSRLRVGTGITLAQLMNFRAISPTTTGATVTSAYGLYMDSQKVSGVTFGYGIYQLGTTDINYFGGSMGIGTTAPKNKLDVAGAVSIGTGYAYVGQTAPTDGLIVQGNVGIGTATAGNKLDVNGAASIGFGTAATAPTNGLAVSGSVVVGNTSATSGTSLDLGSTTSSLLFPTGTTGTRPSTGANGMMRYNSANGKFEGYQSNAWQDILTTATGGGTIYIGTALTSANPQIQGDAGTGLYTPTGSTVSIITNATERMQIGTSGAVNIIAADPGLTLNSINGIRFPSSDSTTGGSIAIGSQALNTQNGAGSAAYSNTAVGYQTIGGGTATTSMINNTAMGYQALKYITTASANTAVGFNAMFGSSGSMQTGGGNTAVGRSALHQVQGGASSNTALGANALYYHTTGNYNTAVGSLAMFGVSGSDLAGTGNTAVGVKAMTGITTTAANNTALGYIAGSKLTTGASNVIIGSSVASTTLTTGSSNILLGTSSSTDTPAASTSNWLSINNTIFGDMSGLNFKIGGSTTLNTGAVLDLSANTNSFIFPVGTTGTRPGTGFNGMMRYNSANGKFEGYQSDAWQDILTTATGGGTIYIGTALTSANPQIQGDAGTGLYTPTGSTVSIVTGATERLRVDSSGNVGIGTTTPAGILDVEGGTAAASTSGSNINIVAQNGGTGTTNGGSVNITAGAATGGTNGAVVLTGTGANVARIVRSAVSSNYLAFSQSGSGNPWTIQSNSVSLILAATGSNTVTFMTNSLERVRVDSAGNVGIGTTAPTNKLDVTGAVAIGTGYAYVGQAAPSNGLIVQGNVGIGTATAGNKLDVNGAASIGFGTAATAPTSGLAVSGSVVVGNTSATSGTSLDLGSTTSSLLFPVGTTGTRPSTGANGMMRYNSANGKFEGYQANAWQDILTTATGGGTIYIGTQLTNTNPRIQTDAGTGLYTPAGSTISAVVGAVEAMRWNTLASAVDYISVTPGKSGTAPIIAVAGATTNQNLTLTPLGTGGVNITTSGGLLLGGSNGISVPSADSTSLAVGNGALNGVATASAHNTAVGYQALNSTPTGTNNTSVGYQSMKYVTSGGSNTAVGYLAMQGTSGSELTGSSNTAVGSQALLKIQTTAASNSAFGVNALVYNTTGSSNTAVGAAAMLGVLGSELTGSYNTAVGVNALTKISTTANNNTAVGYQALNYATTASANTALGNLAMQGTSGSELTGGSNTAVGSQALLKIQTTATSNSALGGNALLYNTTGSYNTAVGVSAMFGVSGSELTGNYNTALGYQALTGITTTGANNTAMGRAAGSKITTGGSNLVLGYNVASTTLTTGSSNILLGTSSSVDTAAASTSNWLSINNAIFGDMSGLNFKIGGSTTLNTGAVLDLSANTNSFIFPVGTTGTRPGTGFNGMMRYNSANGKFEGYQSNAWQDILTTATGGGTIYIGTAKTSANPQIQTDASSGLYTPAGSTISAVAGGVEVERWNTLASAVDYISVTPGKSGTAPIIAVAGSTTDQNLTLTPAGTGSVNITVADKGLQLNGANAIRFPSSDSTAGASIAIGASALANQNAAGSAAYQNTAIGYQAIGGGTLTTAAVANTAVGYQALRKTTSGTGNTALGLMALTNNTSGISNVAVGYQALATNSTGAQNTAVGTLAGGAINGSNITAVGYGALNYATAANAALGTAAGRYVSSGAGNAAFGNSALQGVFGSELTGSYNTAVGDAALSAVITTAANNTAVGRQAGKTVTTGGSNLILGYNVASTTLTTGSSNILLGTSSSIDTPASSTSNWLSINNTIFGDMSGLNFKIGGSTTVNTGAVLDLSANTNSFIFPVGTTGTRPGTGFNGMMRYNSTNGKFEGYQSDAWQDILTTATGGGTIYIGTQLTNTNPRIQTDAGTGLYTPTGSTVSIVTNATERLRVDSSGNVGIGTTSPTSASVFATGRVLQITDTTTNLPHIRFTSTNGEGMLGTDNSSTYLYAINTGSRIRFGTVNTERMRIDASGNVGIGTTAPTNKLDVTGGVTIGTGYAYVGQAAPSNGLLVQGNVGIGTTTPTDALQIGGTGELVRLGTDGGANYQMRLSTNQMMMWLQNQGTASLDLKADFGSNAYLTFRSSGNRAATFAMDTSGIPYVSTTTTGVSKFYINTTATFLVDANNNVGIGTATVGNKLDVNGAASIGFGTAATAPTSGLAVSGSVVVGAISATSGTALDLSANTSSLLLPVGTTATRPSTGTNGMMRYNSGTAAMEGYINNSWSSLLTSASTLSNTLSLGTSKTVANPSISGDLGSGFFTPAGSTVSVAAGGVEAMRWNTLASAVDYISVTPGKSGTAPKIAVAGSTTDQNLDLTAAGTGSVNITAADPGLTLNGINGIRFPTDSTTAGSVAIGSQALATQNAAGSAAYNNTALGFQAMGAGTMTTAAIANTAVGNGALMSVTSGSANTAVGQRAMRFVSSGLGNTAVGRSAMLGVSGSELTGSHNTAVGNGTLAKIQTTASNNTAVGYVSGGQLTTGSANLILGYNVANTTLTTGSSNILLGTSSSVDTPAASTSNWLSINNAIFGDMSGLNFKIGGSTTLNTGAVLDLSANTNSLLFPTGTTGTRPGTGTNGMMRYNSANGKFEGYQSDAWQDILTTATGGGTIYIGTTLTSANPQIQGDTGTGLYTPTGSTVSIVTNAAERLRVDSSGKVGIGTTTPIVPLEIGTSLATGFTVAVTDTTTKINSAATQTSGQEAAFHVINQPAPASTSTAINIGVMGESIMPSSAANAIATLVGARGYSSNASTAALTTQYGVQGWARNVSTATVGTQYGLYGLAQNVAGGTVTTSYGAYASSGNLSTGSMGTAYGLIANVSNSSSGAITTAYGATNQSANNSTGTITTAYGAYNYAANAGTGTITTAYGSYNHVMNYVSGGTIGTAYAGYFDFASSPGSTLSTGTVTTGYGIYIGSIYGTTKYSLYAADSASPSYFAGNVGIGTATAGNKLDVNGAASIGFGTAATAPTNGLAVSGSVVVGNTSATSGTALDLSANTSSLLFPVGTTGTRPSTGTNGMMRYNSGTAAMEGYINNSWSSLLTSASPVTIGASLTSTNPSISGDLGSGLYTPAGSTVSIVTNATERLRVDSSGNVAIGTTTALSLLHIQASANGVTSFVVNNPSTGTLGSAQVAISGSNNNGTLAGIQNPALLLRNYGSGVTLAGFGVTLANYASISTGSTAGGLIVGTGNSSKLILGTNGTAAMTVDTSQNVGIGTATVGNKLDVNGAASIGYGTAVTAPSNGLIVSGSVGIGTTSANAFAKVDIIGAARTEKNFYVDRTGGSLTSYFTITQRGAAESGSYGNALGNGQTELSAVSTAGLILGANSGPVAIATGSTEKLRVDSTGNVGIGTTAPTNKLDVTGAVAIGTGYAYVGQAAPSNGLLVQGSVGIGTTNPGDTLTVGNNRFQVNTNGRIRMNGTTDAADLAVIDFGNSTSNFNTSSTAYGVAGSFSNAGTGSLIGVNVVPSSTNAGTVASAISVSAGIRTQGATITSARAVSADSPIVSSGAVTTAYGLYMNQQKVTGVTTGYGLYQADSGDINYFAGNVGIGSTSPGDALSIGAGKLRINSNGRIRLNGTTNAADGAVIDFGNSSAFSSSSTIYGVLGELSNAGSGDVQSFRITASSSYSGTVANVMGMTSIIRGLGATITSARAFSAESPVVSSGAITTAYGVYINRQKIASGVTTGYGLYQADSNDINYFAGSIGIGTATAPSKLTVYDSTAATLRLDNGTYATTLTQGSSYTTTLTSPQGFIVNAGTGSLNMTGVTKAYYMTDALGFASPGNVTAGAASKIGFLTNGSSSSFGAIGANWADNNTFDLMFYSKTGGTDTERMRILSSGAVGIGTTAPASNGLTINNASTPTLTFQVAGTRNAYLYDDGTSFYVLANAGNGVKLNHGDTLWTSSSDRRLKTDIEPLKPSYGLDAIAKLQPVTFHWRDPNASQKQQIGLIAQDVQSVIPEIVGRSGPSKYAPDGELGIQYAALVTPLIKAVQELKADNDNIHKEIAARHLGGEEKVESQGATQTAAASENRLLYIICGGFGLIFVTMGGFMWHTQRELKRLRRMIKKNAA